MRSLNITTEIYTEKKIIQHPLTILQVNFMMESCRKYLWYVKILTR